MRIVIDLQGAQTESRFRGIGRYTISLAQAIVRNRGEHEVVLALNGNFPNTIEPIRAAFDDLIPQSNIRVWYTPGHLRECENGNAANREVAEKIREAFLKSLEPDIVHVSSLFEGYVDDAATSVGAFDNTTPTMVTLYDLIPLLNPEQYLLPNPAYEKYYLRKIKFLTQAAGCLGISDFSTKDGCEKLGIKADEIFNISSACDPKFKPVEISAAIKTAIGQRYAIDRPFVLYTGGADSRKNLHRLISAYAQLALGLRNNYQLVLAGHMPGGEICALQATAETAGLKKDELIFTGYVSDEDLVTLYNLCSLFVFPSWYEGFGLPALEAMSCGAPVIAANTSSLPEVIGWEGALFDPYSEPAIANKIQQALTDSSFRAELIRNGVARAKLFSWDASAKCAIAAFEQVHSKYQQIALSTIPSIRHAKLAYISPLPPERSGIADYSAELLPELAKFYEIDVILDQGTLSDAWVKTNCSMRSVDWFRSNSNNYDRVIYHFGNSSFHQHMFKLLNEVPGIVVLHDFFLGNIVSHIDSTGYQPGMWIEELYKSHGYKAIQKRFNASDVTEVIWEYPCNFGVLQNAKSVIVHSEYSRYLIQQWYGREITENCSVIPLMRLPAQERNQTKARQMLDLKDDDFVVCSFGVLGPHKLNHRLLEAWLASDLAKNNNCILVFVGENDGGNYGEEFVTAIRQSGLKHRIRITGWVDTAMYRYFLDAADIGVQLRALSRGETSAAVLDCMNYGLTTIINANGSMAEIPNDCVWKLPDQFEDADLTKALETLWKDDPLRKQLALTAQKIIANQHTPDVCAEKYFQHIENTYKKTSNIPLLISTLAQVKDLPSTPDVLMPMAEAIAISIPPKFAQKQLLIDVSALVHEDSKTGIQRVVRSILMELLINPPEGYRIEPVYATHNHGYHYARSFTLKFLNCPETALHDDPIEFKVGDKFLGLDLEPNIVPAQQNFYQKLRNFGVEVYFVVYDLLPVLSPEVFPEGAANQHQAWLKAVAENDGAICISKAVANELEFWMSQYAPTRPRPFKIDWFHLGADVENSAPSKGLPKDAEQTLAQIAARTSFLMVGTIEPRKGYLQTLEAFTLLWQSGADVNLVIVGKEGWKSLPDEMRRTIPEIVKKVRNHTELNKRLFWLEGISDEYLEKIYAASTCLIAASEGEGFGLPLIEAAQHGLPIIASDIPVFREVAGAHAYYFEGAKPEQIAEGIRNWIELNSKGGAPQSVEMPWLTWRQSALNLISQISD